MTATSESRPTLYRSEEIAPLLSPRTVAVVGASERPGAFGGQVQKNLMCGGATVYPVNPKAETVFGVRAFASLADIDADVDLVAICVPQAAVVDVAREAFEAGIRAAVIYGSGFAETGTEAGIAAQQELVELARKGLRILGPNCLGFIDFHRETELQFIEGYGESMVKGGIGVVAQSGALGYLLTQAQYRGVGFSYWVAPGNSVDVDALDLAGYMLDDDNTRVVVVIFEGTADGRRIFELGRRAAAVGKPVIVHKLGQSEIGGKSARSHTGALAGSNTVYHEAFRRAGLVVVDHFDEIIQTAAFFGKAGRASTNGVGVFSASGGAAIMAADEAEPAGVPLPPLQPETAQELATVLPGFGTIANPADVTAEAVRDPEIFQRALDIFGSDPGFALVLVTLTVASENMTGVRARIITEFAAQRVGGTPTAVLWLSEWESGPGADTFAADPNVAIFFSLRAAMAAVRSWLDWSLSTEPVDHAHDYAGLPEAAVAADDARAVIAAGVDDVDAATGTLLLDEAEGKTTIRSLGVTTSNPVILTPGSPDLERELAALAYPVVAKVVSRHIAHKARVGGVRLSLQSPDEVRAAVEDFAARFARDGVPASTLVESMVTGTREWFVGGKRDAAFGVVLTVGLGGTDVEGRKPILIVGEPSPAGLRRRLADDHRILGDALAGRADLQEQLAIVSERVLALFAALPELEELDINPLMETPEGLVAVDAALIARPIAVAATVA